MDMFGFVFLGLALLLGLGGIERKVARADRRAARIERRLDLIVSSLGIEPQPEPWHDEVLRLVRADKRIQAIKTYREATGAGLAEAKEAVEKLA